MWLGSSNYYPLLILSTLVLFIKTAEINHYHLPDSYYDSQDPRHSPPSSLSLDNVESFIDIPIKYLPLRSICCVIPFMMLVPLGITVRAWDDPSPSRAPPQLPGPRPSST